MSQVPHPEPATVHVRAPALHAQALAGARPALDGLPVVVALPGVRAVVLSATACARAHGITPGTALQRARALAPHLVVLAPDPLAHQRASQVLAEVLGAITPAVAMHGLDQAFLDVAGARRMFGPPEQVAALVARRVLERTGARCAVGLATTATLAALVSARAERAAPTWPAAAGGGGSVGAVLVVSDEQVPAFLATVPIAALPGIGQVTATHLQRLGIHRVADLATVRLPVLVRLLGRGLADRLLVVAAGADLPARPVPGPASNPAICRRALEHAFDRDVVDQDAVLRAVLGLCVRAAIDLRQDGRAARVVTLGVRLADHSALTRSTSLDEASDLTGELYAGALAAWRRLGLQRARARAVSVQARSLIPAHHAHHQLRLGEREVAWAQGERAADAARARFGPAALGPASLLPVPVCAAQRTRFG